MASFTDQISQFNPYIQQLPVDAMVKVGMQKQAQYDQGVQKIQGYIDNIAGMDVMRDVDKQHLQSKLNELGSRLKTVAAGDFSNAQLVNSVGGMAGQIVKDPYVQAAVYSYSNDNKNMKEMEKAKEKGELTPHAEYVYNLKRNTYLNNPNLKDDEGKPITFSGKYIKGWDLDGNLIKAVDAVGDGEWTAQNIWKTVNGKIQHKYEPIIDPKTKQPVIDKSTGKPAIRDLGPELADAAVEAKRKGKFSENVQAAIDSVFMRPEAQQELAMRGVYDYRGYDDINDFVNQYNSEKEKGKALLDDRKITLMASIASETDPEKKKELQNMLTSVDGEVTALSSAVDDKINQAKEFKSLDNYKAALYQQRMRNLYMKSGVTERESRTYVENEALTSQRAGIKAERDWIMAKAARDTANFTATTGRMNTLRENEKWALDPTNPNNPNSPLNPNYKLKILEGGATPEDHFVNFVSEGINLENTFNTTKEKFVVDWLKTINSLNGKSISDEGIRKQINDSQSKDPNFLNRKFEEAKENVRTNATNSKYANLVSSLPNVDGSEKALQNYYDQSLELDKELKTKGLATPDVSKLLTPTDVTYTVNPGFLSPYKTVTTKLSAKDMYNLAAFNANSGTKDQQEKIKTELVKRFGLPIDKIKETFFGYLQPGYDPMISPISGNFVVAMQKATGLLQSSKFDEAVKAKGEMIKDRNIGDSPLSFGLHEPGDKPETKKLTIDNLKMVLNKYGVADEDVDKFTAAYSGPEGDQNKSNVQFDIDRGGSVGGSVKVNLSLYTGGAIQKSIEITKDDMDVIKQIKTNIPAGKSAVVKRLSFYKENGGTNSKTSDPNDPNAYQGAFYKSSDFFKLKRKDIMGADVIVNSMGQPNVWFYVNTKNGVIGVPVKTESNDILPHPFGSADAAEKFITELNSSGTFDSILKNANIK